MTFQPEDDIAVLMDEWKSLPLGEKTRRINAAIRCHFREAAIAVAEREVAEAQARLKLLKDGK